MRIQRPYTVSADSGWGLPHIPITSEDYGEEYYPSRTRWKYCNHLWLDTGMRRTYCKHCDVRGDRNMLTGEVTVLPDEEENNNIEKGRD